ncbi:hypothetical protein ACO2Q8_18375 [Larkinella sp. VNQ87]|uniref:hypothetical protein n=1 Tax=Larkinella sp. VNQ87 TaxID=3400921 RepID=UPI003C01100C
MKNVLLLPLLLIGVAPVFGQCDKTVALSTSKTEYLDASNTVERSVDEKSSIEMNGSEVIIIPGGKTDHKMVGKIQSNACAWSVPYKDGKSVVKALFQDPSGNQQNATLTLEGKEGKLTFLMEVAEMPGRKIRVSVDEFAEKK